MLRQAITSSCTRSLSFSFFFSCRRRHTRCALVTGVQTCALPIFLSDTVGFISELPTQVVAAFRATLEEVLEADVILHVRDIADPDTELQNTDVAKDRKSVV